MLKELIRDKMKETKDISQALDAAVVSSINDGILNDFFYHLSEFEGGTGNERSSYKTYETRTRCS